MYERIKLQPLASHKFKLLEDFTYRDVVVPKGYKTNGADIPRIFWSIYPPNRSDFLPAVIIHELNWYKCYIEIDLKFDTLDEIIDWTDISVILKSW